MRSTTLMERARRVTEDVAFVDTCTITTPGLATSDGAGGTLTGTPTFITSRCRLREVGSGTERAIADKAGFQQPYAIDLPVAVTVSTAATITVDGREMEVGGVSKAGAWARKQTAIVRQRG